MSTLIRIQQNGQVTIPTRLRTQAGLSMGDMVEAAFERGKIILTPKVVIDRSKFPNADDEYTPAQRRIIDARLDRAEEEIKQGHVSPTFETAADFAASLRAEARKLKAKTKRSSRQGGFATTALPPRHLRICPLRSKGPS
jgi:bifunctional DNA-binding transcriptional regulator/antitoxin component of YhaV-PrlF toxin-antitoxin module